MDLITVACGDYIILQVSYLVLCNCLLRVNLESGNLRWNETSTTAVSTWDTMRKPPWKKHAEGGSQSCQGGLFIYVLHKDSICKRQHSHHNCFINLNHFQIFIIISWFQNRLCVYLLHYDNFFCRWQHYILSNKISILQPFPDKRDIQVW